MIHNHYKDETIANAIQRPKLSKELELGSDAHKHGHVLTLHLIMYVHHLTHTSLTRKTLMIPNCSKDESIANPIQRPKLSNLEWDLGT